eukprot:TRINITY_DN3725_c0_g1_i1.p1 TRINITY_DN3725_c0_g1~~TRINITY_DN3725_c0_g1_i1.p1  ORF type:complete len:193 (+),score=53.25 TRINITY_DN3725_c0_g1_i1:886-1464(+)
MGETHSEKPDIEDEDPGTTNSEELSPRASKCTYIDPSIYFNQNNTNNSNVHKDSSRESQTKPQLNYVGWASERLGDVINKFWGGPPTKSVIVPDNESVFRIIHTNPYNKDQWRYIILEDTSFKRVNDIGETRAEHRYLDVDKLILKGKTRIIIHYKEKPEEWYETELRDKIASLIKSKASMEGHLITTVVSN